MTWQVSPASNMEMIEMALEVRNILTVSKWRAYQHVYDFVGDNVLKPLNETGDISGIMPTFWENAPEPDNESGRKGLMRLRKYAAAARENADGDPDRADLPGVRNVEQEYQYLFRSKPRVITAVYRPEPGEKTLAQLYEEAGLKMEGEERPHEHYLDIQLIYLAHLCGVAADDMIVASDEGRDIRADVLPTAQKVAWFIEKFPLAWMGELRKQVDDANPDGYFSALFEYLQGLLNYQLAALSE